MNIYSLAFLLLLFPFCIACNRATEFPPASHQPDSVQSQKRDKAVAPLIVFKSTDDGQTWQDISEGLPAAVKDTYGVFRNVFFADANGLYLTDGHGLYHNKPNATAPFWTKENFPDEHASITPGKTGIIAYNFDGHFLQKLNGTGVWSPIFTNLQEKRVRTFFETAGGTIFIGSDKGLFKSTNSGKTWKQINAGGWAYRMVESKGVLMAAVRDGIIRSTDDGENWDLVMSEVRVNFGVERIKDGFAAITDNPASKTKSVRTSYDGGKTWQSIDPGLPDDRGIASFIEVGENFFCSYPKGIYRSSDKGKTWKLLLLPSIDDKVFNLSVSGNVIYAIPRKRGC